MRKSELVAQRAPGAAVSVAAKAVSRPAHDADPRVRGFSGFVESGGRSRRNLADRRAYAIEATPSGLRTQHWAVELLDECERHYLTPLTSAEQRQFYELLARLVAQNPAEERR